MMRPAWAHAWSCKSSADLATARQVKLDCVRVTERGKEAWNVNREPRHTKRTRGGTKQREHAMSCEAHVVEAK